MKCHSYLRCLTITVFKDIVLDIQEQWELTATKSYLKVKDCMLSLIQ